MKSKIPERSIFTYIIFSILTLGIYSIVFWTKVSKEVNVLCEGDGKTTKKYFPAWLLNFVTLGIYGLVWKCKLADRLKDNAERYNLDFSEGGGLVLAYSTIGFVMLLLGPTVAKCVLIKNFNQIVKAYNDYNGLVDPDEDKKIYIFSDEEIEL